MRNATEKDTGIFILLINVSKIYKFMRAMTMLDKGPGYIILKLEFLSFRECLQ